LNDKYTDKNGITNEINGSEGLTLNINAIFTYQINSRNQFALNLAAPLVVRNSRPDGLTRSFLSNFQYSFNF
jgi:hypothetical protein